MNVLLMLMKYDPSLLESVVSRSYVAQAASSAFATEIFKKDRSSSADGNQKGQKPIGSIGASKEVAAEESTASSTPNAKIPVVHRHQRRRSDRGEEDTARGDNSFSGQGNGREGNDSAKCDDDGGREVKNYKVLISYISVVLATLVENLMSKAKKETKSAKFGERTAVIFLLNNLFFIRFFSVIFHPIFSR